MKKLLVAIIILGTLLLCGCGAQEPAQPAVTEPPQQTAKSEISVPRIDGLSDDFIMGADVSSVISLENSGVEFYGFDGQPQDLLKTLSDAGINYIRVRVWNNPYDAQGNGYGGGNCDLDNAIAIGKRAAKYGMKLLLDLHYSDFWADPGKQQVPKAWADLTYGQKSQKIYDYTAQTLEILADADVDVGMIQIGNETTGGFCGEWTPEGQYGLMRQAAQAVRDTDSTILIAVHYTNPEKGGYSTFAGYLDAYQVDYDVFSTSYYPYWHGTIEKLKQQLQSVVDGYGKKVMIAETSWAYTAADTDDHHNSVGQDQANDGPYAFSVQGQADELSAVIDAIASFGESGVGAFYWEPAWIAVPGSNLNERSALWEKYGSGWASSFAGEYDPSDAGKWFGGSACDNQALFDETGHPLPSLMTFTYVRTGEADSDSLQP